MHGASRQTTKISMSHLTKLHTLLEYPFKEIQIQAVSLEVSE